MGESPLKSPFDVVIVGGGINGCGLIRDLALNGVKTLLIEKGDFASQTSESSSKMLHGGIRYLENFDFALVQEALEEKNLWLKLAPHLCSERPFFFPVYKDWKYPPIGLRLGLWLYDFLSHFQNKPHGWFSKNEVLEKFPELKSEGLLASGQYFDGIVDDHKLALECLYDALLEPCAHALNYHEVTHVARENDLEKIAILDRLTGEKSEIRAKFVVYLTGPFTDELLPKLGVPWTPKLVPSKGIHLWLKPGTIQAPGSMVLTTKDNRVIFVIPQRDAILVGTTETPVDEEIFDIKATEKEISYLLEALQNYFPHAPISQDSIISTFAGVRPLAREEGPAGGALGKVSRFHKIYRPTSSSYVMIGGKYTTFRRMCQELAFEITPRLGKRYEPNLTLNHLRVHSIVGTFKDNEITPEAIKTIIQTEKVRTFEDLFKRRLSRLDDFGAETQIAGLTAKDLGLPLFGPGK
jgi:glycerol-3-phosphate dehydrogenase